MASFPSTPGFMMTPGSPYRKADGGRSTNFEDGVRHVTIRQILRATHILTGFEIENRETGLVTLVANVYDVEYRGGGLDFGLDDGTGRIKAHMWDLEGIDAERELAEFQLRNLSYVQATGRMSEYRGIYSILLRNISFVEDPHEIYNHLLRVMVESLILRRGPPTRELLQSLSQIQQPPEDLSMRSLQRDLPNLASTSSTQQVRFSPTPQPQPPSEHVYKPDEHIFKVSPISQLSPANPESQSIHVDELPLGRNFRIGGVSPTTESIGLLHNSFSTQPKQDPITTGAPKRPPRSCHRPPTMSIQPRPEQQARLQPESIPRADSLCPDNTSIAGCRDSSSNELGGIPVGSLSRPIEPPATPLQPLKMSEPASRRRDPYSHLTSLQRDIILTIQNALSAAGEVEKGIALAILVKAIARRRPQLRDYEFQDAFDFLIDEGYIYNTIDDDHYSCT